MLRSAIGVTTVGFARTGGVMVGFMHFPAKREPVAKLII